jgi:hypothetical protein
LKGKKGLYEKGFNSDSDCNLPVKPTKRIGYVCFAPPKEAKVSRANDDALGTFLGIVCHKNAKRC